MSSQLSALPPAQAEDAWAAPAVGRHRRKYEDWLARQPDADLGKACADLRNWIADLERSLATMRGQGGVRADLLQHLADLEDALGWLEGLAAGDGPRSSAPSGN